MANSDSDAQRSQDGGDCGQGLAMFCGVLMPKMLVDPFFEEDLPLFQTRHDDVFVASFPKSGTTWMKALVWGICNNGATSGDVHMGQRVANLDFNKLKSRPGVGRLPNADLDFALDALPSPRLLTTHLPYNVIPKGDSESTRCKYVYIARNPLDAAVSGYFFYQQLQSEMWKDFPAQELEGFLENFREGKGIYGLWYEHVLEWWKHRNDANVLFLKYEDVHKDVIGTIRSIANFLDKNLSDQVVAKIAKQCSFQEMVKNPKDSLVKDQPGSASFLCKGRVGDWKNHLSDEMAALLKQEVLSKLEGSGLSFDLDG